jgi:hypothetical protein
MLRAALEILFYSRLILVLESKKGFRNYLGVKRKWNAGRNAREIRRSGEKRAMHVIVQRGGRDAAA